MSQLHFNKKQKKKKKSVYEEKDRVGSSWSRELTDPVGYFVVFLFKGDL